MSRLVRECGHPEPSTRKAPLAWALAVVPIALAALAGPTLVEWHRLLERFGRDLLLAMGVIN